MKEQPEDFFTVIDEGENTILHLVCEKNIEQMVSIVIETLFDSETMAPTEASFMFSKSEFINKRNRDGFSALHFACFRGNMSIIRYLLKMGADPYITDHDKHNVLHIAAQGDQVAVIHFFLQNYEFDVNTVDCKNSTPLHWASYLGKEVAISYLIAWGANVNCVDNDGMTPLHLSVLQSEESNDARCTKILLLKGADRESRNGDGDLPIDIIPETLIKDELEEILQKPSYCTCMMLRVPLTKLEREWKTALTFVLAMIFNQAGFILFILPNFIDSVEVFLWIVDGILLVLIISFYLIATIKDPGQLKPDKSLDFQELLETLSPYNLCPDCKVIRTPRSRHCNICNKCVERFDHHCPYLNNCIGYRNHTYFLIFIFLFALNLAYHCVLTIYALAVGHRDEECWQFLCPYSPLIWLIAYSVIYLSVCLIFLPFVTILAVVHTFNFSKNMTTNERFTKRNDGHNNSILTQSLTESFKKNDGRASTEVNGDSRDSLIHMSFVGPQNPSCCGNCYRMATYKGPSQKRVLKQLDMKII